FLKCAYKTTTQIVMITSPQDVATLCTTINTVLPIMCGRYPRASITATGKTKSARGVSMTEATAKPVTAASPSEQRLPLLQMILVSFQHVLLMYGGAVAVPLIVGQAAGLSREEIAFLINADLLVAGIATLVQSLGLGDRKSTRLNSSH